ncbi:hypothetical protein T261_02865 [Streptomyces lydicus]|nr:hypothetical protein T261_02865 [Streptomyces lydicus]
MTSANWGRLISQLSRISDECRASLEGSAGEVTHLTENAARLARGRRSRSGFPGAEIFGRP